MRFVNPGSTASTVRWLALLVALVAGALLVPMTASSSPSGALDNLDVRHVGTPASAEQRSLASELGARVTWSKFGTPSSLAKAGGFLETNLEGASASSVAREWLAENRELFGLKSVAGLKLVSDARLAASDGHAVIFRQTFGGLDALQDGTVTVGVTGTRRGGWDVAYVSSSLTRATTLLGTSRLTAQEAWVEAAANVGRGVSILKTNEAKVQDGRSVFAVHGFARPQQARLGAFPTAEGVVPAYETIFVQGTVAPSAYKHVIDARSGKVLLRESLVHQAHQAPQPFTGSTGAADGACGPMHGPYAAPANTVSIEVVASADVAANDIVLKLYFGTTLVQAADTLFSPEAIHYEPAGGVPPGDYFVEVCEFADGAPPLVSPLTYSGTIFVNDVAGGSIPYPPKWKVFPANPTPSALTQDPWNNSSADIRETWCWDSNVNGNPIAGCDDEVGNLASRVPWDLNARTGVPTFKTEGNNARSGEAWSSPLTPGAFGFQPTSPGRNYSFPWTNVWFTSDCFTPFAPGVSHDISAATTNLFAMHNRMHDWSYFLGFTEENWNAQAYNFGLTSGTRENDAVIGNAQAGALTGGAPSYLGRDNANMISLPDGTPPITNMYLWQPLAGAFYPPCVDGDYDMAVIAHEYAHLIENRMIGKGGTRSGHHAGAMGESTADLNAMEVLNEYGFVPVTDENPYSVGAYATGNKDRGIRNYGMNFPRTGAFPTPGESLVRRGGHLVNPLNFSDIGYDITGSQVHADGEIWSATNFDIRQALIDKYGAGTPQLQRDCAEGRLPANQCPGNRRWIQLVYDAYLLMQVAPTMLEARDAMLSADQMRFGGANQREIWLAFARRGFGENAFSTNALSNQNDNDPKPDFGSPQESNATITFQAVAADEANAAITNARVYVGHYEARVSPIADTDPATNATGTGANNPDAIASFAPGTYEFVANAPRYGHVRFRETFAAGETRTVTFSMSSNRASLARGATASGNGTRFNDLIDDTEGTNWERTGAQAQGSQVTVNLEGMAPQQVGRVQVSALLLPGQNRFTALRQFAIEVSTNGTSFTRVFTSGPTAFPGETPRPVAPELILRSFDLGGTFSATHVRIVVLENQCTGNTAFQGEQDADPTNVTDCRTGSPGQVVEPFGLPTPQALAERDTEVRIAELQVFGPAAGHGPPHSRQGG